MHKFKERPILFGTPMVRALLAGLKGHTRRICKNQPHRNGGLWWWKISKTTNQATCGGAPSTFIDKCPYGLVGDRLWVKETFSDANCEDGPCICYKADYERLYVDSDKFPEKYLFANWAEDLEAGTEGKWRPSIFMPRIASRILLEIVDIKVEQLNSISEEDCIKEGIHWNELNEITRYCRTPVDVYKELWESINGIGSWDINPFVWVIEFKVLEINKTKL